MGRIAVSGAGDDRARLELLRTRLAAEIDACTDRRVLVALGRQFIAVIEALADLKPPRGSRVDEIAKRRAARRRAVAAGQSKNSG